MKDKLMMNEAASPDEGVGTEPFVNEECGDTIWEEVLKALDKDE